MSEEINLQQISYQIQQLQQQLQIIEQQFIELSILKDALDEIKNSDKKDSLIPIGPGVFVKGKLEDKSKVIMNIGSDIFMEKNIDEAKELIEKQLKETKEVALELEDELNHQLSHIQGIE
ncbi:MAG: prefoldin subunit alpha [Candidatus Nanoarchaeia archaeon]|nr:prefoldin subunit alpha [Candidatus Nanoarchaeia archaeon]